MAIDALNYETAKIEKSESLIPNIKGIQIPCVIDEKKELTKMLLPQYR